ncbi:neuropeptide Y receptor type 6-like [Stylophora pistillata]|uniref:neuropeptide Y receptor type 6-like n=1 Tax=Stylophora pistillata TaxID=50429 RepID=UPI000C042F52|nr:neuropeptide Y receptor type 6-like [Stylophora pistillata]
MPIDEFMDNCTENIGSFDNLTWLWNSSSFNRSASLTKESNEDLGSLLITKLQIGFQLIIALLGTFGNVMVFTVIREMKRKKSTTDIFVQNLSVADLGIFLLSAPLVAIKERMPYDWPFGKFACLYLYPIPEMFHGASVWCIAVIAFDRYRKIITPRRHSWNNCRAKYVVVSVWVVSFLALSLPLYFVVEYQKTSGRWCGPRWSSLLLAQACMILLTVFSYLLPLAVISWTYLAISRTIRRSNTLIKNMTRDNEAVQEKDCRSSTKNARLRQNKRAKKILTPMVLVFAVTMLPLNVLRLIIVFWPAVGAQDYYQNLLYTISVFVMLNSAVNPVIYSVASRDFRRGMKNLFHKES